MKNQDAPLPLEKEFQLRSIAVQIESLNLKQAREMCNFLYRQMMMRKQLYRTLLQSKLIDE